MKLTSTLLVGLSTAKTLTEKDCRTPQFCNRARRQLCASDGATYADECAWKKSVCVNGNENAATMVAFGSCDEYEGNCRAKLAKCVKKYKPVCGDNGVTFGNSCAMDHHNCIAANTKVKEAYKGECKQMENDVQQCVKECSNKNKKVCGSDGKTYKNKCFLENEACSLPALVIVAKGACPAEAEEDENAVDNRLQSEECPKVCTRDLNPVCGNNYQTYGNECVIKSEMCFKDEKLSILHPGPCKCPSLCPASVNLVCGTDGKTYTSACHLARSRCGGGETEPVNVEFDYWGECENAQLTADLVISPEVQLKFGRPRPGNDWRPSWARPVVPAHKEMMLEDAVPTKVAPEAEETEPRFPLCPRMLVEVCGADGKNYDHPCYPIFYNVSWKYGRCPTMAHDSVVVETTPITTEAAEVEKAVTTPVTTLASTEAPVTEYIPKMDCACFRSFRPVCGSNGYTYANECLAECDDHFDFEYGPCSDSSSRGIFEYDEEEEEVAVSEEKNTPKMTQATTPATTQATEKSEMCACHKMMKPVCGVNGNQYTNDCLAACAGEEVEFKCKCDSVRDNKCVQMANDFFGGFGFGFGAIAADLGFQQDNNSDFDDMVSDKQNEAEAEAEALNAKCDQNCRRIRKDEKCGLINGAYKKFLNWCELDVALCKQGGADVSYAQVCGMKRNGVFKLFATGCQAEDNNASAVDMSLCDDAREFNEDSAKTQRSGGNKGSIFQPWRFHRF